MSEFRRQALAFPGVEETPHHGSASFRVGGKIFAQLSVDDQSAVVKLPRPLQELMIGDYPDACLKEAGRWGDAGWTRLDLSKFPQDKAVDCLAISWRLVAPAKLTARYDASIETK